MLKWLPFPLLRASVTFSLGIWAGHWVNQLSNELELIWLFLVGCFCWLNRFSTHHTGSTFRFYPAINQTQGRHWRHIGSTAFRRLNPLFTVLGLLSLLVAGMLRSQWEPYEKDPELSIADFYYAKVVDVGQAHPRYQRSVLQVQCFWADGEVRHSNDRIHWYQQSNQDLPLQFGDKVLVKGTPRAVNPPANPKEFDYANYLSKRNIFWQHWVDKSNIVKLTHSDKKISLTKLSLAARWHFQQFIENKLPSGEPQEIAGAMLLGNRDGVSDHLEQSFAVSGTVHILAVSGLHLGIIYWLLLRLFGGWRSHSLFKWLFLLVSLGVIWSFTWITGLAASTQRAATMFTVLIFGNTINKESSSLNTLGGSAMLILLIDPYQLFSVGFQLSYAALGGILFLHPKIVGWWQLKNRGLRYFWELISVSLSAQISVLPITIYYFHQFSSYFLLGNLLMVPLAFALIVAGVLFMTTTFIPGLVFLAGQLLILLTTIAGQTVHRIAALPGSSLTNLYIEGWEVWFWYATVLVFIDFCQRRRKLSWLILIACITLILIDRVIDAAKIQQRQLVAVYQIPGHTAIDFIDKHRVFSIYDIKLLADTSTVSYKIKNFHQYLNLRHRQVMSLSHHVSEPLDLWMFKGKRVLLVKAPLKSGTVINELKSDIVIVCNNSIKDLSSLTAMLTTDLLIIDGSNSASVAENLHYDAMNAGLKVHNCWTQGAKLINL